MKFAIALALLAVPAAASAQDTILGDNSKLLAFENVVTAATQDPSASPMTAWTAVLSSGMRSAITPPKSRPLVSCHAVTGKAAKAGEDLVYESDAAKCVTDQDEQAQAAPREPVTPQK